MQTTKNTVRKETVIIADRQAPVTQKQKKTDHIGEKLRLEIFKTSAIIFFWSRRHGEKSQLQLCWSISDFLRALAGLCWLGFAFNFSDALFSPCTGCSLEQWPVIFYLMKGHFPFFSQLKSSTSPPCANGVARACLGCKYANYTSKVNNTVDFQVSSN